MLPVRLEPKRLCARAFTHAGALATALVCAQACVCVARAGNLGDDAGPPSVWSFHAQATTTTQGDDAFRSPYVGPNSLVPGEPWRTTETATIFLGARLGSNWEFYLDPEAAGGRGLSGTTGAAAFPNGEATRVGDPQITPYIARVYIKYIIGLGGAVEKIDDGPNQVATTRTANAFALTAGKFSAGDIFDNNSYSHDPRSQFSNWALMANGAWDYPADTRGYTFGLAAELRWNAWTWRAGILAEPTAANGPNFEHRWTRAHGLVAEVERRYQVGERKGVLRWLSYDNRANMGDYGLAIAEMPQQPDVTATRALRQKFGTGLNFEQEISEHVGVFGRAGWNDGHTETWAFTEIDRTLSLGISVQGASWHRPNDTLGIAGVIDGLSHAHRAYLEHGGVGFIIGDGRLRYATEDAMEIYYALALAPWITVTADSQLIANPGYNRDRGPALIGGVRVHLSY